MRHICLIDINFQWFSEAEVIFYFNMKLCVTRDMPISEIMMTFTRNVASRNGIKNHKWRSVVQSEIWEVLSAEG